MRVFIVHAHPEPQSSNGAMTREAVGTLTAAGHEANVSAGAAALRGPGTNIPEAASEVLKLIRAQAGQPA